MKKARLVNFSSEEQKICLLDGIQNIVPHGVGSELQSRSSNLADAYKRSELEPVSGLGLFALGAIIVDKAEPSEALKTNVAFSLGLENPVRLLSSFQLKSFRRGGTITQETDVKGEKGAYFVGKEIVLPTHAAQAWMIVANVNQTHAAVIRLMERIKNDPNLEALIQQDIDEGSTHLLKLIASADGLQASADPLQDSRHLSNVLFNVMRGGIFDENYAIGKEDFLTYLEKANRLAAKPAGINSNCFPPHFRYLSCNPCGPMRKTRIGSVWPRNTFPSNSAGGMATLPVHGTLFPSIPEAKSMDPKYWTTKETGAIFSKIGRL